MVVVIASVSQILGKLGDKIGRAVTYNFGFAVFGLAGLLAGFSQPQFKGMDLIGYRCLQGLGGACIFVSSAAIVADRFAPFGQVGLATGVIQLALAVGFALGPVIGGGALRASWSWIFWVTVPTAVIGCALGFWKNKDAVPFSLKRVTSFLRQFNILGCIMLITSIALLVVLLSEAVFPDGSGAGKPLGMGMLGLGFVLAGIIWIVTEFRAKVRVLSVEMFRSRDFTIGCLGIGIASFCRSCFVFALTFFYQGPYGQDPLMAGVYLVPLGVGLGVGGFLSGRLADRIGFRTMCVVGPLVAAVSTIGAVFHKANTPYAGIAFTELFIGLGYLTLPHNLSLHTKIRMTLMMLCQMFAIILVFKLILASLSYEEAISLFLYGGGLSDPATTDQFLDGLHKIYYIAIAVSVLVAVISFFIKAKIINPGAGTKPDGKGKVEVGPGEVEGIEEVEDVTLGDLEVGKRDGMMSEERAA
ncbi:hypothetical protein HDV00_010592 [Rhizophlyctis rosea]|nr:hypothetical protein HDV00_010592 [Rhizophlyctis rosea]